MTEEDILTRLTAPYGYFGRTLCREAAEEIKRLREENLSLTEMFGDAIDDLSAAYDCGYAAGKCIARAERGE